MWHPCRAKLWYWEPGVFGSKDGIGGVEALVRRSRSPIHCLEDHKNLEDIRSAKWLTPRQARWANFFNRDFHNQRVTPQFSVVDRFFKAAQFIPLPKLPTARETAKLMLNQVFRLHGLPRNIVSDRGPQFTSFFLNEFWLGSPIQWPDREDEPGDGDRGAVRFLETLHLGRSFCYGWSTLITPCPAPILVSLQCFWSASCFPRRNERPASHRAGLLSPLLTHLVVDAGYSTLHLWTLPRVCQPSPHPGSRLHPRTEGLALYSGLSSPGWIQEAGYALCGSIFHFKKHQSSSSSPASPLHLSTFILLSTSLDSSWWRTVHFSFYEKINT